MITAHSGRNAQRRTSLLWFAGWCVVYGLTAILPSVVLLSRHREAAYAVAMAGLPTTYGIFLAVRGYLLGQREGARNASPRAATWRRPVRLTLAACAVAFAVWVALWVSVAVGATPDGIASAVLGREQ